LRTALETLVRQGETDLALRLVLALTWFWFLRGRLREARRSLTSVLSLPGGSAGLRATATAWQAGLAALAGDETGRVAYESTKDIADPAARARAEWFLGHVASTLGDMDLGGRLTSRALAGFHALGDRWGIAAASSDQASQSVHKGDLAGARAHADRGAALFHELGDRWGQLQASFVQGSLSTLGGDYARSARLHREGLRMAEELGLWPEVSYQLSWLGRSAMLTGDHGQAREFHERARHVAATHGFKPGEMYAETGLALGARREGKLDLAEKHLRSVLDWHRQEGSELAGTLILAELGFVAELRGDLTAATALHKEGYALACRSGDPRAIALALEGLAGTHTLANEPREAARLLGAAAKARESVGTPLPPAERADVERATVRACAALGEHAFTEEFARGAELHLAESPCVA
jgi:hypothetical protein